VFRNNRATNKVSQTTLYCRQNYITYKKSLHVAAHNKVILRRDYLKNIERKVISKF